MINKSDIINILISIKCTKDTISENLAKEYESVLSGGYRYESRITLYEMQLDRYEKLQKKLEGILC